MNYFTAIYILIVCFSANVIGLPLTYTNSGSIILDGKCYDVQTEEPVECAIYAVKKGQTATLSRTEAGGKFSIGLSEDIEFLVFESNGYIRHKIPVNYVGEIRPGSAFEVRIPMSQLKNETPLNQSHDEVNHKASASDTKGTTKLQFDVMDMLNNVPVKAEIKLIYSDKTDTKNYNVEKIDAPFFSVPEEIGSVKLEVRGVGYQSVSTVLKLEQGGSGSQRYLVRLWRPVNLLSLNFSGLDSLQLYGVMNEGAAQKSYGGFTFLKEKDTSRLTVDDVEPGSYFFAMNDKNTEMFRRKKVSLRPGLNFMTVSHEMPEKRKAGLLQDGGEGNPDALLQSTPRENPVVEKSGRIFNLNDTLRIYFDQGSYDLSADARKMLDDLARFLEMDDTVAAAVTGYTANIGREDLNVSLSEYRARTVANYLKQNGASPVQVSHAWKGPVTDDEKPDWEKQKVEIVFSGK